MGIQDHSVALKNESIHLAAADARSATLTPFGLMSNSEWAGHDLGWPWVRFETGQNRATAATAATHDNHFSGIAGLEN